MAKKILVIDDDNMNRKLFRFLLQKAGHDIFEAEDGAAGVKLACEIIPHLVIMDIQMPTMDGIAALQAIKGNNLTCNIPVIVSTSFAMKGDRERYLSEGFVDYISKPINNDDFLAAINTTLERYYG